MRKPNLLVKHPCAELWVPQCMQEVYLVQCCDFQDRERAGSPEKGDTPERSRSGGEQWKRG
jgi:hypothetical protein